MNGSNKGGYRPAPPQFDRRKPVSVRKVMIGGIAVVLAAITVFTALIIAELVGRSPADQPSDPVTPPVSNKFNATEIEMSTVDYHKGDLILINSNYPYVFPDSAPTVSPVRQGRTEHGRYPSGNIIYAFYTQSHEEKCAKLETGTLLMLHKWADDFYKATGNSDLFIFDVDGYRTKEEQESLYATNPTEYAVAGATEHHTGKVIDLYVYTVDGIRGNMDDAMFAETFKWVYDNAYKYGFVLRYPSEKAETTGVSYEPYHFRQVGYVHAYYMHRNNLCLEEYLDTVKKNYTAENPLEISGDDGNKYMVYYIAASTDSTTKLVVPSEYSYTVSGYNMG